MRKFSQDFKAHLHSGVTTLCRVFILSLSDQRRFAFTDHDRPLTFDGLSTKPMAPTQTEQRRSFDSDSGGLKTQFDLDLSREDILSGCLDHARLAEYRVNWSNPTQSVHITTGRIGNVSLTDYGFEADWLGLASLLDRSTGRVFSRRCDAEYGDSRCGLAAQPGQDCARTMDACKSFGNIENFRGFPYLLGDDVLQKGVHLTPSRQGGSRYV